MNKKQIVNKLSRIGIGGNILLSIFKLLAGILGHSGAMVSDAVHSLSDVFATLVAWIGTVLSEKHPDSDHPYGHERFECVASMILGGLLAVTGAGIGYAGLQNVLNGAYKELQIPTLLPLAAAGISIAVKEAMYHYTMYYAKKLNSDVFKADAWHHRSDALSSVGSFVGIAAARFGFPIMDSIASIVICIFILKVAYDVFKDALDKMIDKSCDSAFTQSVHDFIADQNGVLRIDLLQTRLFGSKVYMDVEISAAGESSLVQAHEIAEQVHHGIEKNFPQVKHVMVHVNPYLEG
ncbi:MAG: cation diffusion facilitator family transporter [Eubacteriales bacterium]|nr:cation diffusion facilitator family transporter [Eubacteriales bacterium]